METFQFIPDEYLKRINYSGKVDVSSDTLKALHHAQITTIPFENFDICLDQKIKLDPLSLFNKLVRHKRGGYCFELNGLLLMALQHFGFEARALLGRVHLTGIPTGRSHQITLVTLNTKKWIVDLGFGSNSPLAPLPLEFDLEFTSNSKVLRFIEHDLFGIMLQVRNQTSWVDLYSFDLSHVCAGDISYGNHYTSTHPNSIFVCSRVASLPIENGSLTLFNHSLKRIIGDTEVIEELPSGQAYIDALRENFGIELIASYEQLKKIVIRDN
ncbi:MAG: arylamine N-acetyltransferase [Paraglaciecola sp.]|uniref:arylamine N-acetyltransferase family protein n=1 Tax=Paraglaciecola sp. TaxID=1920173 RepID=UPI00329930DC